MATPPTYQSKTGVTAHLEAIGAVNKIVASIRGEGEVYKYNGRINCSFEMGSGKAMFVVGSYDMPVNKMHPNRLRYAMKKGFASFYWRALSGKWDWLLNTYFEKTCTKDNAVVH